MGQERLDGLALLHCHYTLLVDVDDVIKRFFIRCPRRVVCPVTIADMHNVSDLDEAKMKRRIGLTLMLQVFVESRHR